MKAMCLLWLLPAFFLLACGDKGPESEGPGTASVPLDATPIDPDGLRFQDWEFFPEDKVFHPFVWGRVVDPDGRPVAGAGVTQLSAAVVANVAPLRSRTVMTDEDGVFRLDEFPSNALVIVEAEGWAGRLARSGDLLPNSAEPRELKLRQPGSITGDVRGSDGNAIPGCPVLAFTPSWDWLAEGKSDGEGSYRIDRAPEGDVMLIALAGGQVGDPGSALVLAGSESRVDLSVRKLPPVSGTVVDATTGRPLKTALIRTLIHKEEVFPVDAQGSFRIQGARFPAIFVAADGYGEVPMGLDPAMEEEQRIEVRMEPGARVFGRVVDERGAPLVGVRVEAMIAPEAQAAVIRGPVSDAEGKFAFTWVPVPAEGVPVYLLAKLPGHHYAWKDLGTLGRGEVLRDVQIECARPASIRFRIVNEGGEPYPRATARLERRHEGVPPAVFRMMRPDCEGVADPQGHVYLRGAYGGAHLLRILMESRVPFETVIDIEPGQERTLPDIVLRRGLTISGRLVSDGGDIHRQHELILTQKDAAWQVGIENDEDGRFTVEGLEDKEYIIVARLIDHDQVTMRVRAGRQDVEVRMRAVCFLTARVIHPEAERISAKLELIRVGPTHRLGKAWNKTMKSEEDSVEFPGLPSGRYLLRLNANSWVAVREIDLKPGMRKSVDVRPAPAASVHGRVLRPDGSPAVGVGVERNAGKSWGTEGVKTDDQGGFQFTAIPEGRVTLRSHPYGYPPAIADVNLKAKEDTEVTLQLLEGARVEIDVTDEDGNPIPKVKVVVSRVDGEEARFWLMGSETGHTGANGELVYAGVLPGRHLFRLYAPGEDEPRERTTIDLSDKETKKLSFKFDR